MDTGDIYLHVFSFKQEDVEKFAQITGDTNPLHLDIEYAATTQFKKPIIHGMLSGSVISKILGTEFPGAGTVYLQQNIEFLRPMYVEKEYELKLVITEIIPKTHSAVITTTIKDLSNNKIVVRGEAIVMNEKLF
jgi:acyl dehydratase